MRKIKWDMTAYGIKRMLKSNINVTIVLFFQCTMSFFLIALVFFNTFHSIQTSETFEKFIGDKAYYTLSDKADEDGSFAVYQSIDDGYFKLKKFVEELQNTENITFISNIDQAINIINSSLPEKFKYGYEEGVAQPDVTDENGQRCSFTKSLQISENVFSEFGLDVESGRIFSHADYTYDSSKPIAAILGSEYKEFYQLGDIIAANNVFEDIQLEVIGFFAEDTHFPFKGNLVYTDRYIITPNSSEIDFTLYKNYAKWVLAEQANGEIITGDKSLNVKALVNSLSEKYDTFDYNVYPANTDDISEISLINAVIIQQMITLTAILLLFSIVGISATVVGRIREHHYEYGVHLMSGATLTDILYQVIGSILYLVMGSALIAATVALFVTGAWGVHLLLTLLLALVVVIIAAIGPAVTVLKMDVTNLVRRKE